MKTITEMLVHCEHDGSMIPVSEVRRLMREYTGEQCHKRDELLSISHKLIGEIIDNYEADAINLPAEMYNELKFHWKQLKKELQ